MNESTETDKTLQALKEQITWLKKINDKLAFFVLVLILWIGISVLGYFLSF